MEFDPHTVCTTLLPPSKTSQQQRKQASNNMKRAEASTTPRAVEMRRSPSSPLTALVVLLLIGGWVPSCWPTSAEAFVPSSTSQQKQQLQRDGSSRTGSTTQLHFNRWGSFGDFLNTNRTQAATSRNDPFADDEDEDDETTTAAGTQRLVTLPVRAIKPGGLRLFLMFYFMGMQNTPDRMTWKADQPTSPPTSYYSSSQPGDDDGDGDDAAYVVDMHFRDRTGVLSVELRDDEVVVERVGSAPSTQYLMQESVLVQGVLDELEQCATDDAIAARDRLILLEDDGAIERARRELAFR